MKSKSILVVFALLLGVPAGGITSRLLAHSGHPIPVQTTSAQSTQPVAIPISKGWEYRILSTFSMRGNVVNKKPALVLDELEQKVNEAALQGFEVQDLQPFVSGYAGGDMIVLLRRPRK